MRSNWLLFPSELKMRNERGYLVPSTVYRTTTPLMNIRWTVIKLYFFLFFFFLNCGMWSVFSDFLKIIILQDYQVFIFDDYHDTQSKQIFNLSPHFTCTISVCLPSRLNSLINSPTLPERDRSSFILLEKFLHLIAFITGYPNIWA